MNKMIYSTLLSCLFCAVPSWAMDWQSSFLVDHPLVGQIYDASGQQISKEQLFEQLNQQEMVLIGEKHDNPDHHSIEQELLANLVNQETSVVFEMLDEDLAETLANTPKDISLEELHKALDWQKRGWNWADYGPLFVQVIHQGAELKAGNIGHGTMMTVYKSDIEELIEDQRFTSIGSVQEQLNKPLTELVFASHCEKVGRDKLQPMVNIQLARDAAMANALSQSTTAKKILICGGVHANKEIGVPQHLNKKSSTLLIREVQEQVLTIDEPLTGADFIWFTPQFSDEDYCDKFGQ